MAPICREFSWRGIKNISRSYAFVALTFFQILFPVLTHVVPLPIMVFFNPKRVRECYMEKKKGGGEIGPANGVKER